jgi:hypothetical protein
VHARGHFRHENPAARATTTALVVPNPFRIHDARTVERDGFDRALTEMLPSSHCLIVSPLASRARSRAKGAQAVAGADVNRKERPLSSANETFG